MSDGIGGSIRHHKVTRGWARLVLDIRFLSPDGADVISFCCEQGEDVGTENEGVELGIDAHSRSVRTKGAIQSCNRISWCSRSRLPCTRCSVPSTSNQFTCS